MMAARHCKFARRALSATLFISLCATGVAFAADPPEATATAAATAAPDDGSNVFHTGAAQAVQAPRVTIRVGSHEKELVASTLTDAKHATSGAGISGYSDDTCGGLAQSRVHRRAEP